ncbi:AAA family ATPase [Peribacillus frigoritolerans]|uniref:AAA family ATPase n=1 Tax=Peribacillus frigoritolerans TaxID=450367 RepID=UPI00207AC763|nr:AAA family ATPase [Peribacillus frigoritolerans]USK82108.1 ATP-binding protein [Peribacillus frigoritolerans]WJE49401.1 AAA family ATPase [Peribacillus frigoritolerans]
MELIYLWINEYRNIRNMGFNFSNTFKADFIEQANADARLISIKEKPQNPSLFGGKIAQITSIIGKNGSGKTNILDLLGAKRYDRQSLGSFEHLKYFIIYWLSNNTFAIEGSNFNLIKDSISNTEQENWSNISEPYSIIVELDDNQLIFRGFLQFANGFNYKDSINYYNFRYRYSGDAYRHYQSMTIENEPSHLFNRINLSHKNTGNSAIYQMIIDLNRKELSAEDNTFMFAFRNNVYLKIKPNLHLNDDIDLQIDKGFGSLIDIFKPNSINNRFKFNQKVDFINRFLYKFCHSLASQFFSLPKMRTELSKVIQTIKDFTVSNDNFYDYYLNIINTLLDYQEKNDKYFKHKHQVIETFKGFYRHIYKLDDEWFNKEDITIPLYENYNQHVVNFLKQFDDLSFIDDEVQSLIKVFSIEFYPFSAGEEALMSLFASLYYGLNLNYNQTKEKAIILLDEPDNFMHPEWSRLLIKELCSFLNRLENGYRSYQLVITTHSPFIISDLPKDAVIALDKNSDSGECKQVPIVESFAANIHTLLSQDFFMTSTIGEFAKYKINNTIKLLKEPEILSPTDKEEIDYIISIIGEPLIKNKIKIMADSSLRKKETIKLLKARLMELENDDTNPK